MHAYPAQLADFVLDHWPEATQLDISRRRLAELLSTCFQASLSQEEGRMVRFRLVAATREQLAKLGREEALQLEFTEAQPLTPDTARRLSPAAPFHASSIGVELRGDQWVIWGLGHTGPGWLGPSWDSSPEPEASEALPMIHVMGPGRIAVYAGRNLVASLERGMIEATTTDVFSSAWLGELFRNSRKDVTSDVDVASPNEFADATAANLVRVVSQHMVRRAIFLIRSAGHGGLLLFAEPELIKACDATSTGPLKLKYGFRAGEASRRYRTLLQRLLAALGERPESEPLSLATFLKSEVREVNEIERAIFELSRLVSGLAAVDGAVVLNKRFELIGFGAEVSGELPYPDIVWQALDVEAERRSAEPANTVGTRHRAAYRFVTAHPAGLAIVISHDGVVRFVAKRRDEVVYWDQFLNW